MKKMIGLFVLLAVAVMALPLYGAAAGTEEKTGLVITDSRFIYNRQEGTSFYFAKVENKGTEDLSLYNSVFTAYDADGNVLYEYPDIALMPNDLLIAPGDFAFINTMMFDTDRTGWQEKVDRYSVELQETTDGEKYVRTDCTAEHSLTTENNWTQINLDVTFRNDTEDIMEESYLVYAFFDQEQKIIAADFTCFPGMSFFPQSKIRQSVFIYTDIQEYLLQNNLIPETVMACLYSSVTD